MPDLAAAVAEGAPAARLRALLEAELRHGAAELAGPALGLRAARPRGDRRRRTTPCARRAGRRGAARRPRRGARARLAADRGAGRRARRGGRDRRRARGRARRPPVLEAAGSTDAELAALAFEEQAAPIDRLRARASSCRPGRSPTRPTSARRSAPRTRSRSRRASPRSAAARPTPRRSPSTRRPRSRCSRSTAHRPAARTTTPTPRAASPGASCSASTAWGSGAATTRSSSIWRADSPRPTARWPADRGGAARRRAAQREAVGGSAPRLPQPAAGGRDPRADRYRRGARRADASGPSVGVGSRAVNAIETLTHRLLNAKTLVEAGVLAPARPDKLARLLNAPAPLGPDARGRLHDGRDPLPGRDGDHRRARHAHLRRGQRAHQRPRPTRSPTPASSRATASRSCAATTAASSRRPSPRSKLGRQRAATSTPRSRGPQIDRGGASARSPSAIVFDEEFTELLGDAGVRRKRFIGWHDGERASRRTRCSRT